MVKRLAVLIAVILSLEAVPAAGRPNILLIMIDDLSTDLSIYGNEQVVSPNFERLAARSVRFDRAHSQFPSCNPSRTSMLTGLRPDSSGILDNKVFFRTLLPDIVTLPEFFRQKGYFAMNIGKIFHGVGNKAWDDPKAWDLSLKPGGTKIGRTGEGRNVTGGQIGWARWLAARGTDADQPDGQVALAAVEALEQLHGSQRPFFLAVGFHRPHSPFIAPERYFDLYKLSRLELRRPPSVRSQEVPLAIPGPNDEILRKLKKRARRELMRSYYACVSFIDQQLGLILDTLDRLDGWRDTIVIVTSDHGFHLGEHDWWGKNTLFEPSGHIPLLIYAPQIEPRRKRSPRPVELLDLYPTLVELAGWKPPDHLEGRSLVRLIRKPRRSWSQGSFSQVKRGDIAGHSVRTRRWRYTEWNDGEEGIELYDHSIDPGEYLNLAELPEFVDIIGDLEALLDSVFDSD